jgi:hypothetical protein
MVRVCDLVGVVWDGDEVEKEGEEEEEEEEK